MPADNSLKLRKGSSADWSSANPVLESGEPGFETDTKKIKFGDGTTSWNSLPYFTVDGGNIDISELSLNQTFTYGGTTINMSDHFDSGTPTSFVGQTGDSIVVP